MDRGKGNRLPPLALRQTQRVECARRPIEADERQLSKRDRFFRAGTRHQSDEFVERSARHLKNLREAFGRWPAQATVRRRTLAPVERRRIEAGKLGETRGRMAVARRQPVDRTPDLLMRKHDGSRTSVVALVASGRARL